MKAKWKQVTLNDVVDTLGDGIHGTPKYSVNGKYAFINGNNLVDGQIQIKDSTKFVDIDEYSKHKKPLSDRTIFVSINGTLGNIAMYRGEKVILGKSACYFNVSKNICKDYIRFVVMSPDFRNYLQNQATGTTIKNISLKQMREYPFLLPPFEIQKTIASILSALDDKIELNKKINENLEQQLLALYKNVVLSSIYTTEIALSSLCTFQEGYVNPAQTHNEYFGGDVKWLRAVDINESFIINTSRTLTMEGFQSAKKSALLFSPNTIAISKSGTIGRLGIISDYMCGNRAVINIAPYNKNHLAFIYCYLKSRQHEFSDMAVGSVQKNLYVSRLKPLIVSMPDRESVSVFNTIGALLLNTIQNNCIENTKLICLRDILLPRLMSGELDVSDLDI